MGAPHRPGSDFLVVAPPVCAPSEPPSGAFLLAAALRARGFRAPVLDLSLEFYLDILEHCGDGQVDRALDYLRGAVNGFTPQGHRTASGFIHRALAAAGRSSGWKTTLMDLEPPCGYHSPSRMLELSESGATPFAPLLERVLDPLLDDLRPRVVLVSASYLSQLAGAIHTARHARARGFDTITGGSLPNSLRETGEGEDMLERALGRIEYGDGGSLAGLPPGTGMLDGLEWPEQAGRTDYISPVPVVPFALSTGCFWNRCLFCPDRTQPFRRVENPALASLLETAPSRVRGHRFMVHFLDSALAPRFMREALPILVDHGADFYGFARPSPDLLEGDTLERAAEAGCAMLQLGVESADAGLLDRFCKGTDPVSAARVLERASGLGIRTYAYFLFGLPGEGADSRALTAEFIERNAAGIDFANLSVFNLPVNCELAERAEEFGIRRTRGVRGGDRIRLYIPFTEDGSAPRFEVRRFLAEAGVYGSGLRAIMTRTPRWFRAAHLAMLQLPGRRDILPPRGRG